jgi:hypothetical protein
MRPGASRGSCPWTSGGSDGRAPAPRPTLSGCRRQGMFGRRRAWKSGPRPAPPREARGGFQAGRGASGPRLAPPREARGFQAWQVASRPRPAPPREARGGFRAGQGAAALSRRLSRNSLAAAAWPRRHGRDGLAAAAGHRQQVPERLKVQARPQVPECPHFPECPPIYRAAYWLRNACGFRTLVGSGIPASPEPATGFRPPAGLAGYACSWLSARSRLSGNSWPPGKFRSVPDVQGASGSRIPAADGGIQRSVSGSVSRAD